MTKKNDVINYSKEQQTQIYLFQNGNERAFEYFYYRMHGPLLAYAKRLISEKFTIDTIVQEAFVKAWELREQIKNPWHLYFLIRQTIRWECYHFSTNPRSKFNKRFTYLEDIEDSIDVSVDMETEQEEAFRLKTDNENFKLILKALPYLPGNHKDYLHLFLKYGLNHQKIAAYYGVKYQTVNAKVKEGIALLKQIVTASKTATPDKTQNPDDKYLTMLDYVSAQIYRMRKYSNTDFETIGNELLLPVHEVVMKYTNAVYLLKQMKSNEHSRKTRYIKKDTINRRLSYAGTNL